MFAYTPKLYFFKEIFQNPTIPQSSPLICNPCTHSHIIITLQPIYFSLIPSQYYLRTRVVLNSNVTFSEPEEWTCLQKTSSNLLCFNHWGLSLRISQLGTIQVLTAQLKPDFRPSKCLGRCGSAPKTIPEFVPEITLRENLFCSLSCLFKKQSWDGNSKRLWQDKNNCGESDSTTK